MKKIMSAVLIFFFMSSVYAGENAEKLFREAYFQKNKKSLIKLKKEYPESEFMDVFKIYDALPEYVEEEKTRPVLKMADALVKRAPNFDVAYFLRAMIKFDLASTVQYEQQYAASIKSDLDKAESLGIKDRLPNEARAQFELMACYVEFTGGKNEVAIAHCDAGLKLDSTDTGLHKQRALILYHIEDFAAAAKSFDKAMKKDSKDTYLLNLRGLSKLHSQDFRGALSDAEAGKKIDSNMIEFMVLSARAKIAMGKRRDGCIELNSAKAIGGSTEPYDWFDKLCQ